MARRFLAGGESGGAGLHGDHGELMRDRVVELAGDPPSLIGRRLLGLTGCLIVEERNLVAPSTDRLAGQPRRGDKHHLGRDYVGGERAVERGGDDDDDAAQRRVAAMSA